MPEPMMIFFAAPGPASSRIDTGALVLPGAVPPDATGVDAAHVFSAILREIAVPGAAAAGEDEVLEFDAEGDGIVGTPFPLDLAASVPLFGAGATSASFVDGSGVHFETGLGAIEGEVDARLLPGARDVSLFRAAPADAELRVEHDRSDAIPAVTSGATIRVTLRDVSPAGAPAEGAKSLAPEGSIAVPEGGSERVTAAAGAPRGADAAATDSVEIDDVAPAMVRRAEATTAASVSAEAQSGIDVAKALPTARLDAGPPKTDPAPAMRHDAHVSQVDPRVTIHTAEPYVAAKPVVPPAVVEFAADFAPRSKSVAPDSPREGRKVMPAERGSSQNAVVVQMPAAAAAATQADIVGPGIESAASGAIADESAPTSAEITGLGPIEGASPRNQPPATSAPFLAQMSADLGARVASQLADAARALPDRPVELSLSPEELGRVRLTFSVTDGVMSVAVIAERGETLDLLRRNIDSLSAEFRALGYHNSSFSFDRQPGQDRPGDPPGSTPSRTAEVQATRDSPQVMSPAPLRLKIDDGGMDLRL